MKIQDFPKIIEVKDYMNGDYLTDHWKCKIISHMTYRELHIKSGYTLTIKNEDDYNELVKESNLFELYPANDFFDAWPYYKSKLPIYIEGNFADVLYEDKIDFEKEHGIQTVFGVVERFYSPTYCEIGNVNYPYRLFVYEDYTMGDYQNDH